MATSTGYKYWLYLRVIPGQTLERFIEKTGPHSNDLGLRVAGGYLALTETGAPDASDDDFGYIAWLRENWDACVLSKVKYDSPRSIEGKRHLDESG